MQILLITQEPPLAPDAIATGNAIRTAQLAGALRRAGHSLSQTWLDNKAGGGKSRHPDAFHSRDELQATITRQQPDAILVSYWELLELLPFDLPQPVIVDRLGGKQVAATYPYRFKNDKVTQRIIKVLWGTRLGHWLS